MGFVAYLNINKCSKLLADVSADIEQASEAERVGQHLPLELPGFFPKLITRERPLLVNGGGPVCATSGRSNASIERIGKGS